MNEIIKSWQLAVGKLQEASVSSLLYAAVGKVRKLKVCNDNRKFQVN
jgi:hypothetical protein